MSPHMGPPPLRDTRLNLFGFLYDEYVPLRSMRDSVGIRGNNDEARDNGGIRKGGGEARDDANLSGNDGDASLTRGLLYICFLSDDSAFTVKWAIQNTSGRSQDSTKERA
ncbi:hypothetical protein E2562_005199 [Oryza meyeriana var. granulata]|uniref:Uncharacterized protein n=1 Tax=Oryza meyeriana var. granulata TaxID=110450 RepID=A0A6G1BTY8_9ORYZ|nr:hypothetical protein E2562_005199 [Oryza meyeriana var. granulata]